MKFDVDQESATMPEHHMIAWVAWAYPEAPRVGFQLTHVSPQEFAKVSAQNEEGMLRGRPTYFAIDSGRIHVWPLPDREGDLKVAYVPPMVVL